MCFSGDRAGEEKNYQKKREDTWWEYVAILSRVFAEKSEGEGFLVSGVPYEDEVETLWHGVEYPALLNNPKATKITCVHAYDFTRRQVIDNGDDKIQSQDT